MNKFTAAQNMELLRLVRDELKCEYQDRLTLSAREACSQIDELVASALRQLPRQTRALTVMEAFKLGAKDEDEASSSGASDSGRKRQDAESQTLSSALQRKRLKPGAPGVPGEHSTNSTSQIGRDLANMHIETPPSAQTAQQRCRDLAQRAEEADDLRGLLCVASGKLEAMPAEQRENVMGRTKFVVDGFFKHKGP